MNSLEHLAGRAIAWLTRQMRLCWRTGFAVAPVMTRIARMRREANAALSTTLRGDFVWRACPHERQAVWFSCAVSEESSFKSQVRDDSIFPLDNRNVECQ